MSSGGLSTKHHVKVNFNQDDGQQGAQVRLLKNDQFLNDGLDLLSDWTDGYNTPAGVLFVPKLTGEPVWGKKESRE